MFNKYPYTDFHELNLDWFLEEFKKLTEKVTDLDSTVEEFTAFVTDYFDDLDVQQEINKKLDAMKADGSLAAILQPLVDQWGSVISNRVDVQQGQIDALTLRANTLTSDQQTLTARMDTFASLSVGSTTGDAELMDGRIGGDGITYNSIGDAVRAQYTELNDYCEAIGEQQRYAFTVGKGINASGEEITNQYTCAGSPIYLGGGSIITRRVQSRDSNSVKLIMYVAEYSADGTFLLRTNLDEPNDKVTTGSTTAYIRFAWGRVASSGVTFVSQDITDYWSVSIYAKSWGYSLGYGTRGNLVSDLNYTSIGECILPGTYSFSAAQTPSITDLPPGWPYAGGVVEVNMLTSRAVWQELKNATMSFIRYGTTGPWYDTNERCAVFYTSGAGLHNSTEQLNIYLPGYQRGKYNRYEMGHCVDANIKCNIWRIMYEYLNDNITGNNRQLTIAGEFECAVKISGGSGYIGGFIHGYEVLNNIDVFKDGLEITTLSDIDGYFDELRIVRYSYLYDIDNPGTQIAKHGVEYVYTKDGLKIRQSIIWLRSLQLADCFLAMLPVAKAYSDHYYDDVHMDVTANNGSNYTIDIPKAQQVVEFNDTYSTFFDLSVPVYPSGLSGGDAAKITDNNGIGYHKVYFVVCTSANVSNGTVWKSETVYKHK